MTPVQEILSIDEHRSCVNYLKDQNGTGFRYLEIKKSETLDLDNLRLNYMFCVLNGRCIIQSDTCKPRDTRGGEMLLVPRTISCSVTVQQDVQLIVFGFDLPQNSCDRLIFENYAEYASQITYDASPQPIKEPLRIMLENIAYYLQAGLNCGHLHQLKNQEFFLLIRGFYTKQEIAQLFYPLIGKSLDFRNKILRNYSSSTSVAELIRNSGLSRSSFFVRFKQEFGMTAKDWLAIRVRQEIVHLASNRQLSTKEIMHCLNFDSPQQFNRFCKHNFGLPPTQFIGQIRDGEIQ